MLDYVLDISVGIGACLISLMQETPNVSITMSVIFTHPPLHMMTDCCQHAVPTNNSTSSVQVNITSYVCSAYFFGGMLEIVMHSGMQYKRQAYSRPIGNL